MNGEIAAIHKLRRIQESEAGHSPYNRLSGQMFHAHGGVRHGVGVQLRIKQHRVLGGKVLDQLFAAGNRRRFQLASCNFPPAPREPPPFSGLSMVSNTSSRTAAGCLRGESADVLRVDYAAVPHAWSLVVRV